MGKFSVLEVKFSIYLNRRVFVMFWSYEYVNTESPDQASTNVASENVLQYSVIPQSVNAFQVRPCKIMLI